MSSKNNKNVGNSVNNTEELSLREILNDVNKIIGDEVDSLKEKYKR
jgi:hypothetical protein